MSDVKTDFEPFNNPTLHSWRDKENQFILEIRKKWTQQQQQQKKSEKSRTGEMRNVSNFIAHFKRKEFIMCFMRIWKIDRK